MTEFQRALMFVFVDILCVVANLYFVVFQWPAWINLLSALICTFFTGHQVEYAINVYREEHQ